MGRRRKKKNDDVAPRGSMKEELERSYGVRISSDAMCFAKDIAANHCWPDAPESVEGKMRQVLSEACDLTLSKALNNADEKELDHIIDMLHRSLVELNEVKRAKDLRFSSWHLYLQKELNATRLKFFPRFVRFWEPNSGFPEMVQRLQAACWALYSALGGDAADQSEISNKLAEFLDLLHAFLQLTCKKYWHVMAVSVLNVEEVASRLTGIASAWLHPYVINGIPGALHQQLRQMVLGHDHLIDNLVDTLFPCDNRGKDERPRLPNVFLFSGPSGVGKAQLAKAVALHLYRGLDRLIQIDMAVSKESDLARLAETITARPYSLILFENIEKAHPALIEDITRILTQSKLFHTQGDGGIAYNKSTIIMTSTVGSCFDQVVDELEEFFKPEILALIDCVFVFEKLHPDLQKDVCRLILRDMASSINERGIVVYPSDAALNLLMKNGICDGHKIKNCLAEDVVPVLSKMAANCEVDDGICTIYVDTFVGSSELSFRLEKKSTQNVVEDWFFEKHVGSLRKLRAVYRLEREVVNATLMLKGMCSGLLGNFTDTILPSEAITDSINALKRSLLLYGKSLRSVSQGPKVEKLPVATVVNNRQRKAVREAAQCLNDRLRKRIEGHNTAVDLIAKCVLRSINVPFDPPFRSPCGVYLFLGLDSASKVKLRDDVAENLAITEGKPPIILVDLADKLNSQSLLLSASVERNGSECPFSVAEAVRRWPYCVIVFDKIEKADASVYSTLLQVLDTGILHCDDGLMVDFRNTTIALMSDLGSKKHIHELFGFSHQDVGHDGDEIQQEVCRFRSELLNRVDDILLANPAPQRLTACSTVAMMRCNDLKKLGLDVLGDKSIFLRVQGGDI